MKPTCEVLHLSFVQDPIEPKLMFTGTEFGLWVSIDAGENWTQWTNGYGSIPTQDMVIHPREHDLVIATFGRSFWVLDDISPLRDMATMGLKNLEEKQVQVFDAPDAYKSFIGESFGYRANLVGDAIFEGDNRSPNGLISFYYKGEKEKTERVKVEILDAQGEVVKTMNQNAKHGLNRFEWRLDTDGPTSANGRPSRGIDALPGAYTVKITAKGQTSQGKVNVYPDPRIEVNTQDMMAKKAFMESYNALQGRVMEMIMDLRGAKDAVEKVNTRVREEEKAVADPVIKRGQEMIKAIDEVYYQIVGAPSKQGIYSDGSVLSSRARMAGGAMQSVQLPVTKNDETAMNVMTPEVAKMEDKVKKVLNDYAAYKSYVNGLGIKLISDK